MSFQLFFYPYCTTTKPHNCDENNEKRLAPETNNCVWNPHWLPLRLPPSAILDVATVSVYVTEGKAVESGMDGQW